MRDPVFQRLKEELAHAIQSGRLAPGAAIPSEHSMCATYGISRPSVRKALQELEEAKLIFRRPGKGTFVRVQGHPGHEENEAVIRTIGMDVELPESSDDWYYSKLFHGAQEVGGERLFRLALIRHTGLERMTKGFIDGAIIASAQESEYPIYERMATELGIPAALINRVTDLENVAYFSVDYRQKSAMASAFLLAKGHRRIGVVSSGVGNFVDRARYQGLLDALGTRAAGGGPRLCEVPPKQSDAFYGAALEAYLRQSDISAIYLLNGCFAMPLFAAARRVGIRIPDDLEVMCFDNIAYTARFHDHPFHYVKMPLFEMGRDAAEYLLRKIAGGRSCPVEKRLYPAEIAHVGEA